MRAEGWQARALSWVLAVFATLAMVGAVATMSTNTPGGIQQTGGGDTGGGDNARSDGAQRADGGAPGTQVDTPAPFTTGAPRTDTPEQVTARAQANALKDIAGWLQALTYAVLALVAVTTVGVLALFRIAQARGQDAR